MDKTYFEKTTPGVNLTSQLGNPLPSGTGPSDSGGGQKLPRVLVDETSSMTEMTASSQQKEIGADSTIVTVKEVDKQLQSTEVEGVEEKERKEREEYEELLLDQHNRRVSLERSPTRISQGRPSDGKVTDTQKPEKTDAQEQRSIITNTHNCILLWNTRQLY